MLLMTAMDYATAQRGGIPVAIYAMPSSTIFKMPLIGLTLWLENE